MLSNRRTMFIEDEESLLNERVSDEYIYTSPSKRLQIDSPIMPRLPIKKTSIDRSVPVVSGSPWKHYSKVYAIKHWCSYGVVTSNSSKRPHMIRTLSGSNLEDKLHILCRLLHPNLVQTIEVYPSDTSYFLISEYLPTSLLHLCRSPTYPTEPQLSSLLYQVWSYEYS